MTSAPEIMAILKRYRLPLSDEKRLQEEIEEKLEEHGVEFVREHRLSAADIPDFMVGSLAIEVKIKGSKLSIYKQVERYAQHEEVKSLLLITNVATGFPPTVNGKPAYVFNLARAWL